MAAGPLKLRLLDHRPNWRKNLQRRSNSCIIGLVKCLTLLFLVGNVLVLRTFYSKNDGGGDGREAAGGERSLVADNARARAADEERKVRRLLGNVAEMEHFYFRNRQVRDVVDNDSPKSQDRDDDGVNGLSSNCSEVASVAVEAFVAAGWTKAVYRGLLRGEPVALKTVNVHGHDYTECSQYYVDNQFDVFNKKQEDLNLVPECYSKAANKILKEIFLLKHLKHPNVAEVIAYCSPLDEGPSSLVSAANVALVTELGHPLDLINLLQMAWEERLRITLGLARLLDLLAHSTLGSLVMNDFRRQQFVLKDGDLKLTDVDDVETEEPSCQNYNLTRVVSRVDGSTHEMCQWTIATSNLTLRTRCVNGRCVGHNEMMNIYSAGVQFASFLLPHGAPTSLRPQVDRVVEAFAKVSWDSRQILKALQEITRRFVSGEYLGPTGRPNRNFVLDKRSKIQAQSGYKVYPKSDLPGLYDYRCQLSRSGNGCTISVFDVREAQEICDLDPDCRAFVLTSTKTWTGRTIVHFKSNFSEPSVNEKMDLYAKVT